MFQLIYTSRLLDDLTGAQTRRIVEKSRTSNRIAGISGVLIMGDDRLIQVLEGTENKVRTLYRRIIQDKRHESCEILLTRHCSKRQFGSWSMGFCFTTEDAFKLKIVIAELRTHRDRFDDTDKRRDRSTKP